MVSTILQPLAVLIGIQAGFTAMDLKALPDQISCRHLEARSGIRARALENFVEALPVLSQAEVRGELRDYVMARAGVPLESMLNETVYRIQYPVDSPEIKMAVLSSESRALWGVGFFEHQNPNGGFDKVHYRVDQTPEGRVNLEFDVRAADVCIAKQFDLIFLSGCPFETIRFDGWETAPFVVEWWKCQESTVLSFDLSSLAAKLGIRGGRVGVKP